MITLEEYDEIELCVSDKCTRYRLQASNKESHEWAMRYKNKMDAILEKLKSEIT